MRNPWFILFFILITPLPLRAVDHADSPEFGDYLSTAFIGKSSDINGLYSFLSGSKLVVVMSVLPKQPVMATINSTTIKNFVFNPEISYQFHFDNNGDSVAEYVFKCRFSQLTSDFKQYIRVTGIPGLPTLEGEINTPLTNSSLKSVTSSDSTVRIFAGPREDPCYFDLAGFRNNLTFGTNGDSFRGTNISAIVVEFPLSLVKSTNSNTVGVWATTWQ